MARILVVDDEPEIVVLMRIILERSGHEVMIASNSAECFEKLKEKKPDLILLDVMMPGGEDGWEACRKIKEDEKTRDIHVVMFTVRTSEEDIKRSSECHADAHINKPFDREKLLATVGKFQGV